jgi:hypothetical protein
MLNPLSITAVDPKTDVLSDQPQLENLVDWHSGCFLSNNIQAAVGQIEVPPICDSQIRLSTSGSLFSPSNARYMEQTRFSLSKCWGNRAGKTLSGIHRCTQANPLTCSLTQLLCFFKP